jgi:natural product precursor
MNLKKLKLNELSNSNLSKKAMKSIVGGACGCGCCGQYSSSENGRANANSGSGNTMSTTHCGGDDFLYAPDLPEIIVTP